MNQPEAGVSTPSRRRPGRKPRNGEVASERIWIRLTPAERSALEQVAAENAITITDVLREAVNEFVADYGERKVFAQQRRTVRATVSIGTPTIRRL